MTRLTQVVQLAGLSTVSDVTHFSKSNVAQTLNAGQSIYQLNFVLSLTAGVLAIFSSSSKCWVEAEAVEGKPH